MGLLIKAHVSTRSGGHIRTNTISGLLISLVDITVIGWLVNNKGDVHLSKSGKFSKVFIPKEIM